MKYLTLFKLIYGRYPFGAMYANNYPTATVLYDYLEQVVMDDNKKLSHCLINDEQSINFFVVLFGHSNLNFYRSTQNSLIW